MSFSVTKGFLKLNFRIGGRKPPGHNPLVQNPPVRRFWTRGLCSGVYVRQSWNLAFKSAMCDSVGFIYTTLFTTSLATERGFWSRGVMSGGYVRSPSQPVLKTFTAPFLQPAPTDSWRRGRHALLRLQISRRQYPELEVQETLGLHDWWIYYGSLMRPF